MVKKETTKLKTLKISQSAIRVSLTDYVVGTSTNHQLKKGTASSETIPFKLIVLFLVEPFGCHRQQSAKQVARQRTYNC